MARKTEQLQEAVSDAFAGTSDRLDKTKCVVKGVKILGPLSTHGYRYSNKAMSGATKLYEGVKVNIGHLTKGERPYNQRFGRIRNVRFQEGSGERETGLFGDLHYNGGHRMREQFEWDVENDPAAMGLSHDAFGQRSARDRKLIEAIKTVKSVDLVADAATNVSLFESQSAGRKKVKVKRKRRKISPERKRFLESVRDTFEDIDDAKTFVSLLEAAVGDEEEGPETPKQALARMIMAVFLDESIDASSTKKKILQILKLDEGDKPSKKDGEESDAPTEDEEEVNVPESQDSENDMSNKAVDKILARLDAIESGRQMDRLTEGRDLSKVQRKALSRCENEAEMEELLESWDHSDDEEIDDDSEPLKEGVEQHRRRRSQPSGKKEKKTMSSKDFVASLK